MGGTPWGCLCSWFDLNLCFLSSHQTREPQVGFPRSCQKLEEKPCCPRPRHHQAISWGVGIGKSLDLVSVSFLQRKTQYSTLQEGLAVTGVMTGPGCLGLSHRHGSGPPWRDSTHHCPCSQFLSSGFQGPVQVSVCPSCHPHIFPEAPVPSSYPTQSLLGQVSGREISEVCGFW